MENNYSRILKGSKKTLVVGIVILVISISFLITSSTLEEKEKQELVVKDYNELISLEQDEENEYVELTITDLPYGFAEETEDENTRNYYFAYDRYNYMYIVRLTDSTYERLENIYRLKPENFSYTLRGYIFEDEKELKQLAISVYNEAMEEEVVNEENFRLYFGNTYLDESRTPFTIVDILLIAGICGIFIAGIVLIIYFVGAIKIKKVVKKYGIEELEYELGKTSTISYEKADIYLTDKYIISTVLGLDVLEYNDLVWVYTQVVRQNGIPVSTNLIAFTNKNKRYQLAMVYIDEKLLNQIMNKIKEKNPQVMLGYTKENQQKYKEIKKTNK